MNRNKKELFYLLSFLIEIKTQHKRLNKKRIDLFNFDKQIYKIVKVKYYRDSKVKSNAKALDTNRVVLRIRFSKYGYYKILIFVKEIKQNDVMFLNSAVRFFFE